MEPVDLSIVMPARDERRRLPPTIQKIAALRELYGRLEIVIADDASRDGTADAARQAAGDLLIQVVSGTRAGPGAAARAGMLAAHGERILLCDADGAVPFEDLAPLWRALDEGCDVAAGSRVLRPELVESPRTLERALMGRTWRALVRRLALTGVRDTQCGFKLFRRQAARLIFERVQCRGFAFHCEALAIAQRLGFKVTEVPVRWRPVADSRIKLLADPPTMLLELAGIVRRELRTRSTAGRGEHR